MRIIHRRCAGLDVHKKSISACIRVRLHGHKTETFERVFGTFTQDLEQLREWLKQHKVKHVAMESTGVYWIPVWNVLESGRPRLDLTLVNPQTVQALRGAKTDRIDAARIAEFLQHGLLRGSFVPPKPIRQLRDLTRMRVQVQKDRNRVINRIGRLLETVNIKLGSVASDLTGKTCQAILHAILKGRSQPEQLAELALGTLRNKKTELALALDGRYSEHFRWMLGEYENELERLDRKVADLDERLSQKMEPHAELVKRLCTIPGVSQLTAWVMIAELGVDMNQFGTAGRAASWAGLCPGNSESAGKRMSGKTRKGNRFLRRILIQNAWAVTKMDNCFLTALFYRTAQRRGMKKAAVAVAHRILVVAFYIIRDGVEYREVGGDYFDRRDPQRTAAKLKRRLERIGFQVEVRGGPVLAGPGSAPAKVAEAESKPTKGRGRPCLCATRGIPCVHGRSKAVPSKDPVPKATAATCPQCARGDCLYSW